MGDPSGIGPEIIMKSLSDTTIYGLCRPLIIGDPSAFDMDIKGIKKIPINEVSHTNDMISSPEQMDLMVVSRLQKAKIRPGEPNVEMGKAMVQSIIKAVEMAQNKELAAMVTCPISKDLMNRAGYHFEGHTQLIAHLTHTDDYVMMLAGDKLRVTLVTIHCPYRDVPTLLDVNKIFKTIAITSKSLQKDFGLDRPCIAVAALNPHAGESGLFGNEEKTMIIPAIEQAKNKGFNVVGPLPADTLFVKAAAGQFDAVVSMYHD